MNTPPEPPSNPPARKATLGKVSRFVQAMGITREAECLDPEEMDLVAAALRGDPRAFDVLVRRHLERTLRVALRFLGNREDAEDVTQETFVRAHAHLGSFRQRSAFGTWITTIAIRLCMDRERNRKRHRHLSLDAAAPGPPLRSHAPSPQRLLEARESLARTEAALRTLPPRLRTALILRVFEERDYHEVAAILGTTRQSARIYVSEARRQLARCLRPGAAP